MNGHVLEKSEEAMDKFKVLYFSTLFHIRPKFQCNSLKFVIGMYIFFNRKIS